MTVARGEFPPPKCFDVALPLLRIHGPDPVQTSPTPAAYAYSHLFCVPENPSNRIGSGTAIFPTLQVNSRPDFRKVTSASGIGEFWSPLPLGVPPVAGGARPG